MQGVVTMHLLCQLIECGQSNWLDDLTRDMLTSGALQQRITEQVLRGITSKEEGVVPEVIRREDNGYG
jgi:hypothetical protein